jgi:flagellar hook-associated protein 3 FlgL
MEGQQAQMIELEQQISSGVALSTPADNPVGAAQAVTLSGTSATLTQYTANQTSALSSLQMEDTTLTNVTSVLQSIMQRVQQAQNGSLNDDDRSALAQTIEGYRNELLSLANTTDSQGNYIFSGFQNTSQVFTNAAGGGVTYNGDSGTRSVQVSGSRQVAISDNGQTVFQSVQAVGAAHVTEAGSLNKGTATFGAVTVTNPAAADIGDNYSVAFATDATTGDMTYTVTDTSANPPTQTTGNYTDGAAIDLGAGLSVSISGTPSDGDTFSVTPGNASANSDMFSTIDNIITALQTPTYAAPQGTAALNNALTTGMARLNNSYSNVVTIQAAVGGRESEVKALQTITASNQVQTQSDLANLTSTDTVSAISQFEQLQYALSAAQKTFSATQSLSLFQYINP